MGKLAITLKKSYYKRDPRHRLTLDALGLRKLNKTVVKNDTPAIRGMIKQVEYALEVRPVPEVEQSNPAPCAADSAPSDLVPNSGEEQSHENA